MNKSCHCQGVSIDVTYDPRACRSDESYVRCMQRRCSSICQRLAVTQQPKVHVPRVTYKPIMRSHMYPGAHHYLYIDDPFIPNWQYNYTQDASAHGGYVHYLNNFHHNAIGSPITGFGF
jgi:hypothetical protein